MVSAVAWIPTSHSSRPALASGGGANPWKRARKHVPASYSARQTSLQRSRSGTGRWCRMAARGRSSRWVLHSLPESDMAAGRRSRSVCRHDGGGGEGTAWRAGARRACSKASDRANEPVRSPTRPLRAASRVPRACAGLLGAALRDRPLPQSEKIVICCLTRPVLKEVLGRLEGPARSPPPLRMRHCLRFSTAKSCVHTNVYHHQ